MVQQFKIKRIVKKSDSPFIITLNDHYQLIGNKARILEKYIKRGMNAKVSGYMHGNDFLIEVLDFPDGVVKGAQIDLRV